MPETKRNLQAEIIPLSSPDLTSEDYLTAERNISSPGHLSADLVNAFEEAVRSYTNAQFAFSVSTVSRGLRLAIRAAGIRVGDLVITTPFCSALSTQALLDEGALPVFVDSEPRTASIDPHLVFAATQDILQGGRSALAWMPPRGAIESSPLKAFLPVDVDGQTPDFELILNTAWKYKLKVIEDAHEATGASFKSHPAGSLGDIGVLGFITGSQDVPGMTGMLITDDAQGADLLRNLATRDQEPGNSPTLQSSPNQDQLDAALGMIQLGHLEERISRRARVAGWYDQQLAEIQAVEILHAASYTSRSSWPGYTVRLAAGVERDRIAAKVARQGIATQADFRPLHLQPGIMERFGYQAGTFPVTEDLAARSLGLPFSGVMTEGQVEQVCRALKALAD